MHTPAPRSLWLVPGRALLTRGECGEHGEEESRGGRGGPAGANPGRRVSGAGGSRRGRRRLLAGESCPYADGNCKYPPGECGEGCRGPRGRAAARVGASERERELPRALGGADRHAGRPAGPGGPLRVPSPGSAPPPQPAPSSPRPQPAPAPGPCREAPPPQVFRRPLLLPSQPAARDRPLLSPQPRCPPRLPRRAPGRAVWGAPEPAVATAAAAPGWRRPGASSLWLLGAHCLQPPCPAGASEP